jgi:hypothetical protein
VSQYTGNKRGRSRLNHWHFCQFFLRSSVTTLTDKRKGADKHGRYTCHLGTDCIVPRNRSRDTYYAPLWSNGTHRTHLTNLSALTVTSHINHRSNFASGPSIDWKHLREFSATSVRDKPSTCPAHNCKISSTWSPLSASKSEVTDYTLVGNKPGNYPSSRAPPKPAW